MSSLLESAPPALTSHSAHQHTLTLVHTGGALFRCDGCRQLGADEARYRCDQCDFDLHIPCALPQSTISHPRFGGCGFTFFTGLMPSPVAGNSRICDGCGDDVLGFVYHNKIRDLDLHPCCASLKECIVYNGREFHLDNQAAGACHLCHDKNGRRGQFWTYASFHGNGGVVNMHAACLLYGDQNRNPAGGLFRRSIAISSSTQTASTPIQMTPSPGQMMTTGGNIVATVQGVNAFYTLFKNLAEIAGAFGATGEDSSGDC